VISSRVAPTIHGHCSWRPHTCSLGRALLQQSALVAAATSLRSTCYPPVRAARLPAAKLVCTASVRASKRTQTALTLYASHRHGRGYKAASQGRVRLPRTPILQHHLRRISQEHGPSASAAHACARARGASHDVVLGGRARRAEAGAQLVVGAVVGVARRVLHDDVRGRRAGALGRQQRHGLLRVAILLPDRRPGARGARHRRPRAAWPHPAVGSLGSGRAPMAARHHAAQQQPGGSPAIGRLQPGAAGGVGEQGGLTSAPCSASRAAAGRTRALSGLVVGRRGRAGSALCALHQGWPSCCHGRACAWRAGGCWLAPRRRRRQVPAAPAAARAAQAASSASTLGSMRAR